MIFCFSGTGNSRYVARELAKTLNEQVIELQGEMLISPMSFDYDMSKEKRFIWVFPIYSWGVPPIVADFIKWCKANGNLPVQAKAFEDPFFAEGHYAAYSVMGADPDTYKWFADASETLWMTKEELDIQASDGQENTKFQELLIGAITPEEYLEYRKSFHAWIEDSEWLKEVYPD